MESGPSERQHLVEVSDGGGYDKDVSHKRKNEKERYICYPNSYMKAIRWCVASTVEAYIAITIGRRSIFADSTFINKRTSFYWICV